MGVVDAPALRNVSVGVLGHVDVGKTTLARFLSTHPSTASFDRSPQSQARGITLDLGFSSFSLSGLQVTLVDCPGHASLFRTVLGAAQIIDALILVVDVLAGVQVQTAECVVLAEAVGKDMLIALTKVDLLPAAERTHRIQKATTRLRLALRDTVFADALVVPVTAQIPETKEAFLSALLSILPAAPPPSQSPPAPVLVAVDHCFAIKGHGTIMTGTVLQGQVSVGDALKVPGLAGEQRVKSIQSFHRPVRTAVKGDRVGLGVGALDPSAIERTIVAAPGAIAAVRQLLMSARRIAHFKHACASRSKMHLSVLHDTVLATVLFLHPQADGEYEVLDRLDVQDTSAPATALALLDTDSTPVLARPGFLAIGSKMDIGLESKACRLAFHGRLLETDPAALAAIRHCVFRRTVREAVVDRIADPLRLIGAGLVARRGSVHKFIGMQCEVLDGDGTCAAVGTIESAFGETGKFSVRLRQPIAEKRAPGLRIVVRGKKYIYREAGQRRG